MQELMNINSLEEGQNVSYEVDTSNSIKIAQTFVAFANTSGGIVLFGLKNSGKVIGVDANTELNAIAEIAKNLCRPRLNVDTKVVQSRHRYIVEAKIEVGNLKYKARTERGSWNYFVRADRDNLIANKILRDVWKREEFGFNRVTGYSKVSEEILYFLKKNNRTTLTGIYKNMSFSKSEIDKAVVSLLVARKIKMNFSSNATSYSLSGE